MPPALVHAALATAGSRYIGDLYQISPTQKNNDFGLYKLFGCHEVLDRGKNTLTKFMDPPLRPPPPSL